MKKEHSIYLLIQSLTAHEKHYFKKNGFLTDSKKKDAFIQIFDIINKQKSFNIDNILNDKKINTSIKKHLHVNLNSLYKLIINTMIDYRKEKNQLSSFFQSIEEYEFLYEKKLFDLAFKRIKKTELFTIENKMFHLLPFLYHRMNKGLINSLKISKEYKFEQNLKYEKSIESIYYKGQVSILAHQLEALIEHNKSMVFIDSENLSALKEIKKKTIDLLEFDKNDFQVISSLSNNIFMMNIMESNLIGIEKTTISYIRYFKEHFMKIKDNQLIGGLNFLYNLAHTNLALNNNKLFYELFSIFDLVKNEAKDENIVSFVKPLLINLRALDYFLNPEKEIVNNDLELFINTIKENDTSSRNFIELITATCIILTNEKMYQESLDLTSSVSIADFNGRAADSYVFIKCIRVICWLKLENMDLFHSELVSIYTFLLKHTQLSFAKTIVNFIKKLSKTSQMKNKIKLLKNLLSETEQIEKNGSFYEKMEAIELKIILKLALRK